MNFRALFRQTAEVFWNAPVLWVPVLAADTCRFALAKGAAPLRQRVVYLLLPKSVLGGVEMPTGHLPLLPILGAGTVQWLTYALSIFLYLYALGVLARAVPRVQRNEQPRGTTLLRPPSGIVAATCKVTAWAAVGAACSAWLFALLMSTVFANDRDAVGIAIALAGVPVVVGLSFLAGPGIRRFIEVNVDRPGVSASTGRWQDAWLLSLAVVAGNTVGGAVQYVLQHDAQLRQLHNAVVWIALSLLMSFAGAVPYVFSFIGLSLRAPRVALFVYGTLHPDLAPEEIRPLVERMRALGAATIQGRLLDLGEYPGLVMDGEGSDVRGELFALPEEPEFLAALDTYEGFDPADEDGSLFVRRLCAVTREDGSTEQCWVYFYNRSVSEPIL